MHFLTRVGCIYDGFYVMIYQAVDRVERTLPYHVFIVNEGDFEVFYSIWNFHRQRIIARLEENNNNNNEKTVK